MPLISAVSESYYSLAGSGAGRYEEKKSVFLGFAEPVSTEEQAVAFVQSVRQKYPDARHHVYAYVLREDNKSRYTDDGEPSGTAGMPVLDVLRKQQLTNCALVVVRYFGGTLLGTGGLVRAYTAAAKEALQNAGTVLYRTVVDLTIQCTYQDYCKLSQPLSDVRVISTDFGDEVRVSVTLPQEKENLFAETVRNRTAGRAILVRGKEYFGFS